MHIFNLLNSDDGTIYKYITPQYVSIRTFLEISVGMFPPGEASAHVSALWWLYSPATTRQEQSKQKLIVLLNSYLHG